MHSRLASIWSQNRWGASQNSQRQNFVIKLVNQWSTVSKTSKSIGNFSQHIHARMWGGDNCSSVVKSCNFLLHLFFSLMWLSLHVTYIEPIYCNIFVGDQNQQNTVESSRSTRSAREELPCAVSLGELIFLFAWQDSAIFFSMQYHK